jgi:ABC-type taurine transport system substrate-binding protein
MEAASVCVPMLIDRSSGCLPWEQGNIDFAVKHGLATVVTDIKDVNALISDRLTAAAIAKPTVNQLMREHDFAANIRALVSDLVASNTQVRVKSSART